jgi:hypothetical protein
MALMSRECLARADGSRSTVPAGRRLLPQAGFFSLLSTYSTVSRSSNGFSVWRHDTLLQLACSGRQLPVQLGLTGQHDL